MKLQEAMEMARLLGKIAVNLKRQDDAMPGEPKTTVLANGPCIAAARLRAEVNRLTARLERGVVVPRDMLLRMADCSETCGAAYALIQYSEDAKAARRAAGMEAR